MSQLIPTPISLGLLVRFSSLLVLTILLETGSTFGQDKLAPTGDVPKLQAGRLPNVETSIPDCVSASATELGTDFVTILVTITAHPGTCGCRSKVMTFTAYRKDKIGAQNIAGTFVLEPEHEVKVVTFPTGYALLSADHEIKISCTSE